MIDRAVGVMLDQGHHPDDAPATLRRQAVAAGVEPHIYAARLLRRAGASAVHPFVLGVG